MVSSGPSTRNSPFATRPLQNRVTPTGDIIATPHRGMFTGNRGIIHDPATKTLLTKRWSSPAWITCLCEFRGWRRPVMARRSWTELFFLDEATAFAAGHRPCFFCRRDDANRFYYYEVYRDEAALEAHRQSPHFKLYAEKTAPWLAAPPERRFGRNLIPSDTDWR